MDPRFRGGDGCGLNRSFPRRALAAFAVAAVALVGLGACGFEPAYGRKDSGDVPAEMAAIQIEPIKDRVGQMLHNRLRDVLNPNGLPSKPRYYLKVTVVESIQETLIQRTAFAARANLSLTVAYSLFDAKTRGGIHAGNVNAVSSYSYQLAPVGTMAGEKDARERAVADAAEEVRARLALYFKRDILDREPK